MNADETDQFAIRANHRRSGRWTALTPPDALTTPMIVEAARYIGDHLRSSAFICVHLRLKLLAC
jgi:hypothetical protein